MTIQTEHVFAVIVQALLVTCLVTAPSPGAAADYPTPPMSWNNGFKFPIEYWQIWNEPDLAAQSLSVKSGPEVAMAQPLPSADLGRSPDTEPPRPPRIVTHIPCAAGGQQGIAVGVLPPLRPRYADGAPVVIHVPGGVTTGGTEGRPEYAGLGFVEIRFAFPGGGRGEGSSGGAYDYRGPNCLRALADVIRFATGRLADRQGRRLHLLVPQTSVLTRNVGIVGSSHGGNACGLVMATHGDEFPDLAFYASMESPYGEGNVNIELGGRDQGVNPAYDPETGRLDLSKLAWSADLPPGPPRRWQGQGTELKGALFFDLNGDGRFSPSDDYPANAFVQDLGQGPKAWYTPRLVREAEQRKLYGDQRLAHVPSLTESTEYWRWRDAAGSIAAAVSKCPQVAVIVYANERDHVQVAPDHPHILAQIEGFRQAGARFVRLNPDRAYVERILTSGGPPFPQRPRTFPDNEAGAAWNRGNIRNGLEPADLPMQPYMQAAVCELADRVQAGNWANKLAAVLYPDAPWTAFVGRESGGPAEERSLQGKPPLGPGGLRPPLGKPPLGPGGVRPPLERPVRPDRPAVTEQADFQVNVPPDAGSTNAPLLVCIGVHIEPFGSTVSELVGLPPRPERDGVPPGNRQKPSYIDDDGVFQLHVRTLRELRDIMRRHDGKLTVQAQTPFTRICTEKGETILRDFLADGHEIALHFHEQPHLGPKCESLPVATWTTVMREEIDWIQRACPGAKVRYWSGGNNYPGVLDAAAGAGLDVMSDHKNPKMQQTFPELIAVNPWRPAGGPTEDSIAAFARHDPKGRIVYLPDGVFSGADFRERKRHGDAAYLDAMTEGLVLSLRAARPDRVNVFHLTVHPAELRDSGRPSFALLDRWIERNVAPLVRAGKVRWATFSEMAAAFREWEQKHPGVDPRAAPAEAAKPNAATPAADAKGHITFAVNCHEHTHVDDSADIVLRLVGIFTNHNVRGDFYFTAPLAEAYAQKRPDAVKAIRESGMTVSYHVRPPHPAYAGFGKPLEGLAADALERTLRDYETYRMDPATGELQRDRPGGYALVKQVFGTAPVCVSSQAADPRVRHTLNRIYRSLGAKMTLMYHESGTDPKQPFQFVDGLLVRPSDFSVTRWQGTGGGREDFWWNHMAAPRADASFDPVSRLEALLAEWTVPRVPYATALIHENNFHFSGSAGWNAIYLDARGKPLSPPWNPDAPDGSTPRPADEREAIFRAYEALVARAAERMRIVTSADLVEMAQY